MSSKWSPDGALISAGRCNAEEGKTLSLTHRKLHFSPYCLKVEPFSAHTLLGLDLCSYRSAGGYLRDGVMFSVKTDA